MHNVRAGKESKGVARWPFGSIRIRFASPLKASRPYRTESFDTNRRLMAPALSARTGEGVGGHCHRRRKRSTKYLVNDIRRRKSVESAPAVTVTDANTVSGISATVDRGHRLVVDDVAVRKDASHAHLLMGDLLPIDPTSFNL